MQFDKPAIYVWFASNHHRLFEVALINAGFEVKQQLIWNKGMVLGRSDYHWAHEPCLYARKAGQKVPWVGNRKQRTLLRQEPPPDLTQFKKAELIQMLQCFRDDSTDWEIRRDNVNHYVHPNQKPTDLCIKALGNHTLDGALLLDPFLGSGSSLLACEQTHRTCYGLELDPQYCDVIVTRWQDFTGQQAVHEKTGQTYAERAALV